MEQFRPKIHKNKKNPFSTVVLSVSQLPTHNFMNTIFKIYETTRPFICSDHILHYNGAISHPKSNFYRIFTENCWEETLFLNMTAIRLPSLRNTFGAI